MEKEYQEKQDALLNTSTVRLFTDEMLIRKKEKEKKATFIAEVKWCKNVSADITCKMVVHLFIFEVCTCPCKK